MFTPLLLTLAAGAASTSQGEVIVIDDRPSMVIAIGRLDRAEHIGEIRREIRHDAKIVCDRAYRELGYLETVACVKSAVADGDAQLGRALAHNPAGTSVAAIAVTAPAN